MNTTVYVDGQQLDGQATNLCQLNMQSFGQEEIPAEWECKISTKKNPDRVKIQNSNQGKIWTKRMCKFSVKKKGETVWQLPHCFWGKKGKNADKAGLTLSGTSRKLCVPIKPISKTFEWTLLREIKIQNLYKAWNVNQSKLRNCLTSHHSWRTKGCSFVDQIYSEIEILLKVRKLRILSIPPNPLLVALIFSPQLNSNLVFMSLRKRKACSNFATKGSDLSERCKELLAERKVERNTCEVDGWLSANGFTVNSSPPLRCNG